MLGEEGGAELAVTNRISKEWGKYVGTSIVQQRGVWKGQGETV